MAGDAERALRPEQPPRGGVVAVRLAEMRAVAAGLGARSARSFRITATPRACATGRSASTARRTASSSGASLSRICSAPTSPASSARARSSAKRAGSKAGGVIRYRRQRELGMRESMEREGRRVLSQACDARRGRTARSAVSTMRRGAADPRSVRVLPRSQQGLDAGQVSFRHADEAWHVETAKDIERGAVGGGRLRQRRVVAPLAERPERVAEAVLGDGPLERRALAGALLERGAVRRRRPRAAPRRRPARRAPGARCRGCSGSWPSRAARARGSAPRGRRGRRRPPASRAASSPRSPSVWSALPRLFWVMAQSSGTRSRVRSSSAAR